MGTRMSEHRSVQIEADGGSRGNPGPAAYGAVLLDADTREVIAERAETIGVATNNVAEYSGLIAGLELYREHTPGCRARGADGLQARRRADVGPLEDQAPRHAAAGRPGPAARAAGHDVHLDPAGAEQARRPDRSTRRSTACRVGGTRPDASPRPGRPSRSATPTRGWSPDATATTLVLVRHGVTDHTVGKRFSSGLGGSNPGLADEGRAQIRATADWLSPLAEQLDAVVTSPVRRTHESAEILADAARPRAGHRRRARGDGVRQPGTGSRSPRSRSATPTTSTRGWASLDAQPGGGESFRVVQKRVLDSLGRLLEEHAGATVLVVSHVTPIKVLVAHALGAPLESVFRMEMAPGSVTVLSFYDDDRASLRMFNARPTDAALTGL